MRAPPAALDTPGHATLLVRAVNITLSLMPLPTSVPQWQDPRVELVRAMARWAYRRAIVSVALIGAGSEGSSYTLLGSPHWPTYQHKSVHGTRDVALNSGAGRASVVLDPKGVGFVGWHCGAAVVGCWRVTPSQDLV